MTPRNPSYLLHLHFIAEPLVREIKPEEVEALREQFAGPQAERGQSQEKSGKSGKSQEKSPKVNASKFIPRLDEAIQAQAQVVQNIKLAGKDQKAASDNLAYLKKEL